MALVVEGKLFKVAGATSGGGGSDSHNKGWFATQAALEAAYATAEAGDYAIVGSTDTVWVWDTDDSEWVDSDRKGQVTSVNNQTGAVTLGINDVAPSQTGFSGRVLGTDGFVAGWVEPEIIQRSTMPVATSENQGDIVQYVGATTADYTNGYMYKSVQETKHTFSITFEDPDVSFNPSYSDVLVKAIEDDGVPNYRQVIDTAEIGIYDEGMWYISMIDSAHNTSVFYLGNLTAEEMGDYGFVLPETEPESGSTFQGSVTWATGNVRKWLRSDTGAYIPMYTELPAPNADNLDSVALYMGETIKADEEVGGADIIKGRFYTVKAITQPLMSGSQSGQFSYMIVDLEKYLEQTGGDTDWVTFNASVSGDVVTWSVDGNDVNLSDYGIMVWGTVVNGNSFGIKIEGYGVFRYHWEPLSTAQSPSVRPFIFASDWDEYNRNFAYIMGVTPNNTVIVGPAPSSVKDYVDAGIVCISQDYDTLTFTCETVPENDIELSIAII